MPRSLLILAVYAVMIRLWYAILTALITLPEDETILRLLKARPYDVLVIAILMATLSLIPLRHIIPQRHRLGALAALIVSLGSLGMGAQAGSRTFDYRCYWSATQAVSQGLDPYDTKVLRKILKKELNMRGNVEFLYSPLLPSALAAAGDISYEGLYIRWAAMVWLSILLSWMLLYFIMLREGAAPLAAAALVLFLGAVNVAVDRTFLYTQVNAFASACILGAVLVYPRRRWLSALMMCLAINLKVSPALLVLPFFLSRDVRWLLALGLHQLWITGLIAWRWSPDLWTSFFTAALGVEGTVHRRSPSLDAVTYHLMSIWGDPELASTLASGLKVASAVVFLYLLARLPRAHRSTIPLSHIPPLLVLMVLISPITWAHHTLMLLWPVAMLLPRLRSSGEGLLWLLMVGSLYWAPVFDSFPLSVHRLAALGIWAALFHRVSLRAPEWGWVRGMFSAVEAGGAGQIQGGSGEAAGGAQDLNNVEVTGGLHGLQGQGPLTDGSTHEADLIR